jgi:hypothetical protein
MNFGIAVSSAVAMFLAGCNDSSYDPVDARVMFSNLEKQVSKASSNVVKTDIKTPLSLKDFPLLQEVCQNNFKTSEYKYDGVMLRTLVSKYGYDMPVSDSSMIYRHEVATCSSFYPVSEGETQEAVYVKYLATIDSTRDEIMPAAKAIPGGVEGLLKHSEFHLDLDGVEENGWTAVKARNFPEETKNVQYLKMDTIEMNAILKYDAEKYKDMLAFEMLRVNVTRNGTDFEIKDVDIAVVENGMN